jgi:hypothetical protein
MQTHTPQRALLLAQVEPPVRAALGETVAHNQDDDDLSSEAKVAPDLAGYTVHELVAKG